MHELRCGPLFDDHWPRDVDLHELRRWPLLDFDWPRVLGVRELCRGHLPGCHGRDELLGLCGGLGLGFDRRVAVVELHCLRRRYLRKLVPQHSVQGMRRRSILGRHGRDCFNRLRELRPRHLRRGYRQRGVRGVRGGILPICHGGRHVLRVQLGDL